MRKSLGLYVLLMMFSINLQSQCLNLFEIQTSAVACAPGAVGSATITPLNGLPPYTYTILGNSVTQSTPYTISNLTVGHYSIYMVDSNSCAIAAGFDIGEHNVLIDNIQTTVANCTPNDLGQAMVTVENGDPPFNFQWTGGNTATSNAMSYLITNLDAGDYFVTVTDGNGCEFVEDFEIEGEDLVLQVYDFTICESNCLPIDAGIDNFCYPIQFEWYNSAGDLVATGPLPLLCDPDTYTGRLISCNGCYVEESFVIDQVGDLAFNFSNLTPPTCGGACDGAIDIDVTGGSGNYTYSWRLDGNVIATTEDITDLCDGLYELFIHDGVSCNLSTEFELNCGGFEIIPYFEADQCANDCEAFASVSTNGGDAPFQYVWSNGESGQTIYNLCAGTYNVTVVDANNAAETIEIVITELFPLEVELSSTASSCTTGGSIEINVTEGSGDYNYFLNGTEVFSTSITDLPPGNHTVEIVDNVSGCAYDDDILVGSPYIVSISTTDANCDMNDGTATASIPSGTSTYTYIWSNGSNNVTATNLAPGGYSVTATDSANGCQAHANIIIEEAPDCFVTISGYVINDDNDLDCVLDTNPEGVQNHLIGLDNTLFTFTDENGFYSFQTEPGVHEITYETESLIFENLCIDPITVNLAAFGDASSDNNFFLEEVNITDLQLYMMKSFIRPGFSHFVNAVAWNFGNETVTGSFTMTHDVEQVFLEAIPPETSYDATTRTITWDYTNLNPLDQLNYQVKFEIDSDVPLGTEIEASGEISSFAMDDFPDNNFRTCRNFVIGSYDPNDKEAQYPFEGWEPHTYLPGSLDELTYKIRFQNTGTDTAFTVVIEDELDYLLELRNITPGPSSHAYSLDVRDDNVLQFKFDNILLPDSTTNEAASHGYVFFTVKLESQDIFEGDMIFNQAAIFFDYNTPIYTNEVFTYFENPISVQETNLAQTILLQPNPTADFTTLLFDLDSSDAVSIELLDISGKVVRKVMEKQLLPSGPHQVLLPTNELDNGTYFVRFLKDKELITKKLVVIK